MLEARRCGCRLPLLTCPRLCPRPRTLRLGLRLRLCTSIVTPLPLRRRCVFFYLFFLQKICLYVASPQALVFLSFLFFTSRRLSIHSLLPARTPARSPAPMQRVY